LNANEKNVDQVLTPLSKAIRLNHIDIVNILFENGAIFDANNIPITLANAINREYSDLLELLLEHELQPKQNNKFSIKNIYTYNKSNNPLHPNRVLRETKLEEYQSLFEFAERKDKKEILDLFRKHEIQKN
ncbi:MAG: hypothetical protein AAGA80_13290, partial [Cyanobacteria bacterium P01_F01_bin.143]